jgi:hypothetical protein
MLKVVGTREDLEEVLVVFHEARWPLGATALGVGA